VSAVAEAHVAARSGHNEKCIIMCVVRRIASILVLMIFLDVQAASGDREAHTTNQNATHDLVYLGLVHF
jgi:hypothetical protein